MVDSLPFGPRVADSTVANHNRWSGTIDAIWWFSWLRWSRKDKCWHGYRYRHCEMHQREGDQWSVPVVIDPCTRPTEMHHGHGCAESLFRYWITWINGAASGNSCLGNFLHPQILWQISGVSSHFCKFSDLQLSRLPACLWYRSSISWSRFQWLQPGTPIRLLAISHRNNNGHPSTQ